MDGRIVQFQSLPLPALTRLFRDSHRQDDKLFLIADHIHLHKAGAFALVAGEECLHLHLGADEDLLQSLQDAKRTRLFRGANYLEREAKLICDVVNKWFAHKIGVLQIKE